VSIFFISVLDDVDSRRQFHITHSDQNHGRPHTEFYQEGQTALFTNLYGTQNWNTLMVLASAFLSAPFGLV